MAEDVQMNDQQNDEQNEETVVVPPADTDADMGPAIAADSSDDSSEEEEGDEVA
ncbi:MAG TPA: hypothetical protein VN086_03235 [Candidatus Paceibacterota bacterium]|nr:hypothetical protein [Candidatus Paceibacterota bacterium]